MLSVFVLLAQMAAADDLAPRVACCRSISSGYRQLRFRGPRWREEREARRSQEDPGRGDSQSGRL